MALAGVALIAGCNESLDTGAACPVLCPNQNVVVRDTVLDAIVMDTTVAGFPLRGAEQSLYLATRGDTVDVRGVIRFDTLLTKFTSSSGIDSTITAIDSAGIVLVIDRTRSTYTAPVRFSFFDVDTTAPDTSLEAIRKVFRADRLINEAMLDTSQIKDTTFIPLDNGVVLSKILSGRRLRVGIQVTSADPVALLVGTVNAGTGAVVRFDPQPADTAVKSISVVPRSMTPTDNLELSGDLTDYQVVFRSPQVPVAGDLLSVGGLEGRRAFLRFDIPSKIIDSSTVLRATLLAVQHPVRVIDTSTKFTVQPEFVTAGTEVTDLSRSAYLVAMLSGFDSVQYTPADSGLRQLEMVTVLRAWATTGTNTSQRAIVLRATREGQSPIELQFYSTRAAPALRPRLRVSYATRTNFGIP